MTNQILTRKLKNGEIEIDNFKKRIRTNQFLDKNSDYGFYDKQAYISKNDGNNISTPGIFLSYGP